MHLKTKVYKVQCLCLCYDSSIAVGLRYQNFADMKVSNEIKYSERMVI